MLYFLVMDALFFGDEAPLCGCPIAVPSLPGSTWVPDLLSRLFPMEKSLGLVGAV